MVFFHTHRHNGYATAFPRSISISARTDPFGLQLSFQRIFRCIALECVGCFVTTPIRDHETSSLTDIFNLFLLTSQACHKFCVPSVPSLCLQFKAAHIKTTIAEMSSNRVSCVFLIPRHRPGKLTFTAGILTVPVSISIRGSNLVVIRINQG
jgi:hypothetical protein